MHLGEEGVQQRKGVQVTVLAGARVGKEVFQTLGDEFEGVLCLRTEERAQAAAKNDDEFGGLKKDGPFPVRHSIAHDHGGENDDEAYQKIHTVPPAPAASRVYLPGRISGKMPYLTITPGEEKSLAFFGHIVYLPRMPRISPPAPRTVLSMTLPAPLAVSPAVLPACVPPSSRAPGRLVAMRARKRGSTV